MKTGVILGFGEIMGRVSMPGFLRFGQAMPGRVDVDFAGAEANTLGFLATLGHDARLVTALPANEIGDACVAALRHRGVGTSAILRTDVGRLGLYFLEKGAGQRPGNVVYDRSGSSVALTPGEAYHWERLLEGAAWLHLTGITPALSEVAADANVLAARTARARGIPVSCDLNPRSKLWRWRPGTSPDDLSREQMLRLIPHVTHVVGGPEDLALMLGVDAGRVDGVGSAEPRELRWARAAMAAFPWLAAVGMTRRNAPNASELGWSGFVMDGRTGQHHVAPLDASGQWSQHEIRHVVDRIGTGDAFTAGLIHGWVTGAEPGWSVAFATAASCLAHSVEGDACVVTRAEVEALMAGSGGGRVRR